MTTRDDESTIERWMAADLASAVLPADRTFVAESRTVRALVIALAQEPEVGDDLLDAWAVLGGLAAACGTSPMLASATLDHALGALALPDAAWAGAARAAVTESFMRAILDHARREAMSAWEYPACAVPLDDDAIAVAAAFPSDDPEIIAGWAARVANGAARRGIRRAIVSGREAAAVVEAFAIVGIRARTS
ncbi:MAG: hypothetical protein FWD17_16675 [Polyangiaceae bacterium]|nr:hypothetical protein [Polyangiaceae bacterium]